MSIEQNSKILASDVTTSLSGKAPTSHASSATTYGIGTGSNYGHVKLSDSTSSTSDASAGIAASPKAVKAAYDKAVEAANSGGSKSETWVSGTNWYRKWSDGWIEQGGAITNYDHTTITLHKAYKDTNYTLLGYTGSASASASHFEWEAKTTTSFSYDASSGSAFGSWYTCGY